MSPWGVVVITVTLLLAITALTAARILPTEAAAGILGSLGTAVVMILQRTAMANVVTDAVKKGSVGPPALVDSQGEEINFKGGKPS